MRFERIVQTRPPFDKRNSNPKKNYGVCGLHLWFILKGKKGAVQIQLGTKLYLAKQFREWRAEGEGYPFEDDEEVITCLDVGYHAWKPIRDWQNETNCMECQLSPKGKCWYDGSSLRGRDDRIVEQYLEQGDKFIWDYLEKEYIRVFGADRKDKHQGGKA